MQTEKTIADNLKRVEERIHTAALSCGRDPQEIRLLAASKTQTSDRIRQCIQAGVTLCGENRVQEFLTHQQDNAYEGAQVDFIGHLQRNKVKDIVGQVSVIHSVGSWRLLEEIGKEARKRGISQDILLEVNLAKEISKDGFIVEEMDEICHKSTEVEGINLRGLMAIPPRMEDVGRQAKFFQTLSSLYIDFSRKMSHNYKEFNCLSMGMSDDMEIAIAQGSTLVRVGTALFGQRPSQGATC